jgi:predicted Zn-dependent protease
MSRLEQIQNLLVSEPNDTFLNFGLAMELAKAERWAESLAQFDRVRELDPNYIPAWFQKGNTLVAMGETDAARAVLQEGIAVANRTGDTHAAGEMAGLLETL